MMRRALALGLGSWLLATSEALACAVCWGGAADSPIIDGTKLSIAFMAGLTYLVVGGFIVGFVVIARRSSAANGQQTGIQRDKEQ